MRHKTCFFWLFLLPLFLFACSGGGSSEQITVQDAMANLMLPTDTGAVYMQIVNGSNEDDALLSAEAPGCGVMELHEMTMDNGVMKMRPVEGDRIEIPAGETVTLKQGGLHIMCLGKSGSYTEGEMIEVALEFENAGTMVVEAEIFDITNQSE